MNRKSLAILTATLLLAGCAPDLEEAPQSFTQEDAEAIRSVLLAETDHFFARDYDGWASTFVEAPESFQIWNNADGTYTFAKGWDTISRNVRGFMDANPEPDETALHREGFTIRPYGDAAFVTFVKYMGDRETAKPIQEVRVVEKVDGEWKIALVAAFMDYTE